MVEHGNHVIRLGGPIDSIAVYRSEYGDGEEQASESSGATLIWLAFHEKRSSSPSYQERPIAGMQGD